MGLISRVSSRTYRCRKMLAFMPCKQVIKLGSLRLGMNAKNRLMALKVQSTKSLVHIEAWDFVNDKTIKAENPKVDSPKTSSKLKRKRSKSPVKKKKIKILNDLKLRSDTYEIYTDGAASGNGKSTSKAGIGVYFPQNPELNISERLDPKIPTYAETESNQTNQTAEVEAIYRAL